VGASNNGNVTAITNNRDPLRSQSFTYDALNRLATAQTNATFATAPTKCWGEQFTYDPWANFLSITGSGSPYTGCTQEGLSTTATTKNQISGFCYDAAGNLLAQSAPPCPVPAYTYNAENQLVSTAGVTYTYDGDGKRVKKSNGKLYWYGMGSDPLDETDLAGNTTNTSFNEYIFFGGKRIARRDSTNAVNYYFADHLGTARIVATAAGATCYDSDFYPFGGERSITNTCSQNYKFTGKERDAESGLDNFGARYDSSSMGRFMSPDWSAKPQGVPYAVLDDPQSLNLYAYVRNNPLNRTDPDGHCTVDGEKHNFLWCGLHSLGFTHTQKEQVAQARSDLAGMKNFTINGQTPKDFATNASDKQVLAAKRTVTEFALGQAMDEFFRICPKGMSCGVIPLGLGSTGRTIAANLNEKLAMEEVMAELKGTKLPLQMNDSRWPAGGGWVKMSQTVNGVEIHWVENIITGAVDDFKFK
jgi:RHS repeat-associated protein